jgi:hypothetical protein
MAMDNRPNRVVSLNLVRYYWKPCGVSLNLVCDLGMGRLLGPPTRCGLDPGPCTAQLTAVTETV